MKKEMKTGVVEKIINGGFGLIRSDEGIVFLKYVAPDEVVEYYIRERAKGINWGEVVELSNPHQGRIIPECEYYGECGGCTLSHLKYEDQLRIKNIILKDDLLRIAKINIEPDRVYSSPEFGYRVRAKLKGLKNGKIGFIKKGTTNVMEINKCLTLTSEINKFISKWNSEKNMPFFHQFDVFFNYTENKLYVHLSEEPDNKSKDMLCFFDEVVFSWRGNEDCGESKLVIGDYNYHVSPDTFFQVNMFQWENMLNIVNSFIKKVEVSVDLFSGNGFFIPLLMENSEKVIGVEHSKRSVTLAIKSFKEAKFLRIPAEKYSFSDADQIIIDPPRSGIPKEVIKGILKMKPDLIINISCSTASFARDLSSFVNNGYCLKELIIVDLFPQTAHIETISLLKSC